ncbi:hypothetical protein HMPREF1249_0942 [Jonquetella sp. BV3C21]|nr:hypothetical protein GCWU000246_00431 [Jonquetella anthropi E3_33 E1]ERL23415.1 hypothetical protein HMPREF1249_0942 [Jonquetella sp. BV3C21]
MAAGWARIDEKSEAPPLLWGGALSIGGIIRENDKEAKKWNDWPI